MSEWKPIERAFDELPSWTDDTGTRHLCRALVYGPTWEGGWDQSPNHPERGGGFTGEAVVTIATTYEGKDFWTIESNGPSDYDDYIRPTHFMPLPDSPNSTRPEEGLT